MRLAGSAPIQLGRNQYLASCLTLCLALLLAYCSLESPSVYVQDCRTVFLPSVEREFGFRGREAPVPGRNRSAYTLVEVDPNGVLGRVGFRSGDVPVAYHGGLSEFCSAIRESVAGRASYEVAVRGPAEWEQRTARAYVIPPRPRKEP